MEEVDADCVDADDVGLRPSYTIGCPACGRLLEWPQAWQILSTVNRQAISRNALPTTEPND